MWIIGLGQSGRKESQSSHKGNSKSAVHNIFSRTQLSISSAKLRNNPESKRYMTAPATSGFCGTFWLHWTVVAYSGVLRKTMLPNIPATPKALRQLFRVIASPCERELCITSDNAQNSEFGPSP